MILLQTFNSRETAELAKMFLASENIDCIIRADDMAGHHSSLSFITGVKLMLLDQTKFDQAKELLKSFKI